jgi:hypothetical protein
MGRASRSERSENCGGAEDEAKSWMTAHSEVIALGRVTRKPETWRRVAVAKSPCNEERRRGSLPGSWQRGAPHCRRRPCSSHVNLTVSAQTTLVATGTAHYWSPIETPKPRRGNFE